jgi:hypothetical protein
MRATGSASDRETVKLPLQVLHLGITGLAMIITGILGKNRNQGVWGLGIGGVLAVQIPA